jgi:hypothetical protein
MEFSADNVLKTAYDTALWPVRRGWRIASGAGSLTLRLTMAAAKGVAEPAARLIDTNPKELQEQMPFHEAGTAFSELERAADRSDDPELQSACLYRTFRAIVFAAERATDVPDGRAREIIEAAAEGFNFHKPPELHDNE